MATAGQPAAARRAHALRHQAAGAPLGSSLLVTALIVGVAYYVGAWIGITTAFPGSGSARRHIFWPPNVILLAALLATPPRWWWPCILTTFAAHLLVHAQLGVAPTVMALPVQFAGNVLQAVFAALTLRRVNDPPWRVDTLRSMIMVIAVAGVAAPAVVSALVIHVYVWAGWMQDFASAWRVRTLANAVSTITLAPLLLTVAGQGLWRVRAGALRRAAEFGALLAGLLVVGTLASRSATSSAQLPLLYAPLPFLLWAAVRFGSPGLCIGLVATLLLFVGQTFEGPHLAPVPTDNTIALAVFLVAIAVPLLLLAALVHERRLAEERIAESRQRYQLATVAGDVSVWEWDLETGRLHVGSMLKGALGYADDEIPDTIEAWRAHVPPSDVARMCAAAQAHLDGVTPHCEVEHQMLHKDSSVRWFHARGAVSTRREGEALRMSGTAVDITERKHAEEELRVARSDLAHASRLALVGELMASIAHEIKQPLASILMNAGHGLHLLNMEARAVEKKVDLGEILSDVCDDTRRATDIIERLRALASKRPFELVALDVNDVVNDILRLVGADALRRDVKLHAELAASLPAVAADRVCLQQVLLNLIVNAMDAMEHAETDDRQVIVHTRHLEKEVEIVVCDTGPGIPVDSLSKLFNAFFTTKGDSMGLGLAIARSIVDSHGGRLWAEAHRGRGAIFHVTLPVLTSA